MAKAYDDFFSALGDYESGGSYTAQNSLGYLGKYQFGEGALTDLRYYEGDSTRANDWVGPWTGRDGVYSKSDFLHTPAAQENAVRTWADLLWDRTESYGLDIYAGQKINGIEVTPSGMVAGAHLGGVGGIKSFLTSGGANNPADANGTTVGFYLANFAGYETPFLADLSGNDTLRGGVGQDRLDGKAGNDLLTGAGEYDQLYGGSGTDSIYGGAGGDLLWGGGERDRLDGGTGPDRFLYAGTGESNGVAYDYIAGFSRGQDKIDLSLIDANKGTTANDAFKFVSYPESGKLGTMTYTTYQGNGFVLGDNDGASGWDLVIQMSANLGLTEKDFIL